MRIHSGVQVCEYICVVGVLVMCVLYLVEQTPAHLIFSFNSKPQTDMRIREDEKKKCRLEWKRKEKWKHEGSRHKQREAEYEGAPLHPHGSDLSLTTVSSLTWQRNSSEFASCQMHLTPEFTFLTTKRNVLTFHEISARILISSALSHANFLEDHNSQIWYTIFLVYVLVKDSWFHVCVYVYTFVCSWDGASGCGVCLRVRE